MTGRFRGATVARKPNTLEVARSTLAGIIFSFTSTWGEVELEARLVGQFQEKAKHI